MAKEENMLNYIYIMGYEVKYVKFGEPLIWLLIISWILFLIFIQKPKLISYIVQL